MQHEQGLSVSLLTFAKATQMVAERIRGDGLHALVQAAVDGHVAAEAEIYEYPLGGPAGRPLGEGFVEVPASWWATLRDHVAPLLGFRIYVLADNSLVIQLVRSYHPGTEIPAQQWLAVARNIRFREIDINRRWPPASDEPPPPPGPSGSSEPVSNDYLRRTTQSVIAELKRAGRQELERAYCKGDNVIDPPRVMRLAGTVNYPAAHKLARGYKSELVEFYCTKAPPISDEAFDFGGFDSKSEQPRPNGKASGSRFGDDIIAPHSHKRVHEGVNELLKPRSVSERRVIAMMDELRETLPARNPRIKSAP
jgi:hypothetical protein